MMTIELFQGQLVGAFELDQPALQFGQLLLALGGLAVQDRQLRAEGILARIEQRSSATIW